jgi:hypothetical protein
MQALRSVANPSSMSCRKRHQTLKKKKKKKKRRQQEPPTTFDNDGDKNTTGDYKQGERLRSNRWRQGSSGLQATTRSRYRTTGATVLECPLVENSGDSRQTHVT